MGSRVAYEQYNIEKLIKKGANWLLLNFHKFNTDQKIKIALTLVEKTIPSTVNSKQSGEVIHTHKVEPFDADERINAIIGGRQCLGSSN